jgi:hypothetical protein
VEWVDPTSIDAPIEWTQPEDVDLNIFEHTIRASGFAIKENDKVLALAINWDPHENKCSVIMLIPKHAITKRFKVIPMNPNSP